MRITHLLRWLGVLTLGGYLFVGFTPFLNVLGHYLTLETEITTADAIIVLGAGQGSDGKLSLPSLVRAVRGIELYQLGYAPLLVLLGPEFHEGYRSEARVRFRLARTMQVPPEDMLTESNGLNTRGEARVVAERLGPLGLRTILLVTESQHMIRAKPLFENVGFEVHPVSADDYPVNPGGPSGRIHLMERIMREQAARLYYRAAGYL